MIKFKIPFTISNIKKLKKRAKFFSQKVKIKKKTPLAKSLKQADMEITREEYIGIALKSWIISFFVLLVIFTTILAVLKVRLFWLLSLGGSILFSGFVFFSQIVYPRIFVSRRQKNIEKNLIPALQDILIQVNSGIPLFSVLVNISDADYGELSSEVKKAVRKMNAGEPETEVLDELGKRNPSTFFRRAIWQISNGMKAGSDMSIVIKDSIKSLNEEQLIQIQNYGNKLNPLVVFYMLISVIIPALSITFLTILTSMIGIGKTTTTLMFIGLFVFVIFVQIMFLGMIKSRRPSLL
jgi:pilus assembly protein TadC